MNKKNVQLTVKRIFDFFAALLGTAVTSPVMLGTMVVIRAKSPEAPVIFRQTRTGSGCKDFTVYKLRTMTNATNENGELLPDEMRLEKWGKIIRNLSIDELPQMMNILKGEMSFVGPRPILPREMTVMTPEEQAERQSMPPGITGWEAVNEDKSDSRRRMAEFDLEYVRNWSLVFDVKILFLTAAQMVGKGRAADELRAPKLREEEIIDKRQ